MITVSISLIAMTCDTCLLSEAPSPASIRYRGQTASDGTPSLSLTRRRELEVELEVEVEVERQAVDVIRKLQKYNPTVYSLMDSTQPRFQHA